MKRTTISRPRASATLRKQALLRALIAQTTAEDATEAMRLAHGDAPEAPGLQAGGDDADKIVYFWPDTSARRAVLPAEGRIPDNVVPFPVAAASALPAKG
jgi:hypothetical protein